MPANTKTAKHTLTLVWKRGRFVAVHPQDPEEPITLTTPDKERAATHWSQKDVANALYLTEHPAAIIAAAFHRSTPDGVELTGVFSADQLRAAIARAEGR